MKRNKIHKIFNFFVLCFPILVILLSIYRTGTYDFASISESLFSIVETPLFKNIYNWFQVNLFNNISNNYINIMWALFAYMFYTELIGLFIDFMCFLVRWARSFLNGFYKEI